MASNTPREYMVGLGVSSRGKPMIWARDPYSQLGAGVHEVWFENKELLLPRNVPQRLKEIELSRDVSAQNKATVERSAATIKETTAGQVATHCDGHGSHRALILRPGPMTLALFVTSNPRWSRRARRLTDDEAALLGKPVGIVDYFAPVIREASDFTPGATTFPKHRVEALLVEFFDPNRS